MRLFGLLVQNHLSDGLVVSMNVNLTCSLPKTSPFAMLYSREYAICPAAPDTSTLIGSAWK